LSIVFIRGDAFPPDYREAAVVALHGSWNRSEKDGYKVVSLHRDDDGNITARDLVTGFLEDEHVIGRPAEVTQGPDGAIYVADDYAGAVYRIAWGEEQTLALPKTATATYNAEQTLARFDPDTRQYLSDKGEALFKQYNCIQCHRSTEQGGLKELEELGSKYDVKTLSAWLEKPKQPMPLYPLSEMDQRALSVYLIETY
ncbi:MAG: c-type cytochrome, partial [Pseudomonadales bacterium]|nr:c-type cytochrome [Pseudomonadales bacterium]